ncbi:MAG: tRNA (guanosine(37)-N1)-methyltransferase TrmD [Alphaproteobacteria bacterium]
MSWAATVLTLYPEMFPGPLGHALAGRALAENIWSLEAINIRNHAIDKHGSVDDTPAGGGPGMVMRIDVLARAIDTVERRGRPLWCLTPRGERFSQALAEEAAEGPGLILLCGRFEGFDERLFKARPMRQVSVGDFVLSGGEAAAQLILDACVRLLPGVIGAPASLAEESFAKGLLEYPQYTRPQTFEGLAIPEILNSGNHKKIEEWRRAEAEKATQERRPDLWAKHLAAPQKK